eukprot:2294816-Alexandrium_andersonii.AAC.1
MSASLVGSEMCIRDRSPRCRSASWGGHSARNPAGLSLGLASGAPCPSPPVSYTHLTLPTICSV